MQSAVEIEAQLRAKADEDGEFRALLLKDPRQAIKVATGVTVPEAFSINVHEESATDFHMVLSPAGGRLSDEELGLSSGGAVPTSGGW